MNSNKKREKQNGGVFTAIGGYGKSLFISNQKLINSFINHSWRNHEPKQDN
ncbi:MAG: hypothetical protein JNM51_10695 [Bacteroidia bacterium]|nr:hypothetical protein [Bacteroidia bacterium]